MDWTINYMQPERYMEIQGAANSIGVDATTMLILNYVYEFQSFCTSIIAKLDDGTIVHERNLDFDFAGTMRTLTYIAKFYKND